MSAQANRGTSNVEGNSMLPSLRPGDEVIVDRNPTRIRRGDLVTFQDGDRLIVHRVVQCDPPIVTRGDNAPYLDAPLRPEQLVGRVIEVRRGTRVISQSGVLRCASNAVLGWLSPIALRRAPVQRIFRRLARWIG